MSRRWNGGWRGHAEFGAAFRPDPRNYGGRLSESNERNISIARTLAELGSTDLGISQAFEVSIRTIRRWKLQYPKFREAPEMAYRRKVQIAIDAAPAPATPTEDLQAA